MDPLEDQLLELEALESLYMGEELKVLCRSSPIHLQLALRPDSRKTCHVSCSLDVQFTDCYPQEAPKWDVIEAFGLDRRLLTQLKEEVKSTMEGLLGMPMVYDVAEKITAFLTANNAPPKSMHDEMLQNLKQNKEAVRVEKDGDPENDNSDDSDYEPSSENDSSSLDSCNEEPSFVGLTDKDLVIAEQRCTPQQFTEWAESFRMDMVNSGIWKQRAGGGAEGGVTLSSNVDRLSGRQLFEMDHSLVTQDEETPALLSELCITNAAATSTTDTFSLSGGKATSSMGAGKFSKGDCQTGRVFWDDAELFAADDDDGTLDDLDDD